MGAGMREASPVSQIARSPCLSAAAEQAMERPSHSRRANSVVSRRGSSPNNKAITLRSLQEPLPDFQIRAPPLRRQLDLPPTTRIDVTVLITGEQALRGIQLHPIQAGRDLSDCVASEAILAPATPDLPDCVAAKSR